MNIIANNVVLLPEFLSPGNSMVDAPLQAL